MPQVQQATGEKQVVGGKGAINTTCYVQVLGNGTDCGDCTPSVLIFFDKQRYVFNVGEGFQRFCVEHKVRLSKVNAVLLTRTSSHAAGGLPGLCLTLADTSCGGFQAQSSPFSLYGPPGLDGLVEGLSTYINARQLGLQVFEIPEQGADGTAPTAAAPPVINNDLLTVTPVLLRVASPKQDAGNDNHANGDSVPGGEPSNSSPAHKRRRTSGPAPVACYICRLPSIAGKFLPQKAQELGVPKGRLWGQLKAGQPVEAADGRMVQPHEVLEEGTPGPVALIIDCPDQDYVQPLTSSPLLSSSEDASPVLNASIVIHLGPHEVVTSPPYQKWLASFGGSTRHVLVNSTATRGDPVLQSSARLQAKLHLLHPTIFPLQHVGGHATSKADPADVELPQECTPGRNMLKYVLRPVTKTGFHEEETDVAIGAAAIQHTLHTEEPEVFDLLTRTRNELVNPPSTSGANGAADDSSIPPCARPGARRDALELVFLGTGAAMPSKYRNVTATYLHLFAHGGALVDCGEGTLAQLCRRYGNAGLQDILTGLRFVWISHIHADHHAGLPRLLSARRALLGESAASLPVIGPWPLQRCLVAVDSVEPLAYTFLDCRHTLAPGASLAGPVLQAPVSPSLGDICASAGLSRLESFRVEHCAQAFGVVLEGLPHKAQPGQNGGDAASTTKGWKVAFSGDTRPCAAVVAAAQDADLLVHEATFEDALESEALAKRHSLTREAVQTGQECGAYRTLLTHFSQRYPKIPVFDASFAASTCIAFDFMTVNLADLTILPKLLGPLQQLFGEGDPEDDKEAAPTMLS
ncbi:hypothetical protein WJX73_003185 [Symbiochloris irregularis]|uniref:ribonuclease Z n=1 Tax=Symbiochloris irregularis TaxID=706552 RepID=A0AAW1PBQ0_9CHLO